MWDYVGGRIVLAGYTEGSVLQASSSTRRTTFNINTLRSFLTSGNTQRYSVTPQKTSILSNRAVRTSNLVGKEITKRNHVCRRCTVSEQSYRGHNCRKEEYFLMLFACVIQYPWADELYFSRLPCKVNTTLCTCQMRTARIAPDTLSSYDKNAKQPYNNQHCDCPGVF